MMYDEMDLMGRTSYEPQLDDVAGPYKHLKSVGGFDVLIMAGVFVSGRCQLSSI